MKHRKTLWKSCILMLCIWAGFVVQGGQVSHQPKKADAGAVPAGKPAVSYAQLPLSFEANQGQTDKQVKFLSHGGAMVCSRPAMRQCLNWKSRPWSVVSSRNQELQSHERVATDNGQRTKDNGRRTTNSVLRLKLVNANPNAPVAGTNELPGKVNYFLGNDPKGWRANVPTYAQVRYRDVYPGIDLVYYGNQGGQLEYDFVVAPGADPSATAHAGIPVS